MIFLIAQKLHTALEPRPSNLGTKKNGVPWRKTWLNPSTLQHVNKKWCIFIISALDICGSPLIIRYLTPGSRSTLWFSQRYWTQWRKVIKCVEKFWKFWPQLRLDARTDLCLYHVELMFVNLFFNCTITHLSTSHPRFLARCSLLWCARSSHVDSLPQFIYPYETILRVVILWVV